MFGWSVLVWTFRAKRTNWCSRSHKSLQVGGSPWVFLQEVTSFVNFRHTLSSQCGGGHRDQKRRWNATGSTYSEHLLFQRYECAYTTFWPRCSQGGIPTKGNCSNWSASCKKSTALMFISLFCFDSIASLVLFWFSCTC